MFYISDDLKHSERKPDKYYIHTISTYELQSIHFAQASAVCSAATAQSISRQSVVLVLVD